MKKIEGDESRSPSFLDHADTPAPPDADEPKYRGGITTHFPVLLHAMLTKAEVDGYSNVCSWESHGRAFSVHDRERFVREVLPLYFRQTHFASFQRQLNLYGFDRASLQNPNNSPGAYYHAMFLRTRQDLCRAIQRATEKEIRDRRRAKVASNPDPDFRKFKPMPESRPEDLKQASGVTIPQRRVSAPAKMETPPGSSKGSSNDEEDDSANRGIKKGYPNDDPLWTEPLPFHSTPSMYRQDLATEFDTTRERKRKFSVDVPEELGGLKSPFRGMPRRDEENLYWSSTHGVSGELESAIWKEKRRTGSAPAKMETPPAPAPAETARTLARMKAKSEEGLLDFHRGGENRFASMALTDGTFMASGTEPLSKKKGKEEQEDAMLDPSWMEPRPIAPGLLPLHTSLRESSKHFPEAAFPDAFISQGGDRSVFSSRPSPGISSHHDRMTEPNTRPNDPPNTGETIGMQS